MELKPCPFCGGDASLHTYPIDDEGCHCHVECDSCGAFSGEKQAPSTPDSEYAIATWNTRANVTAALASAQAREDELRFELDCLRQQYDERTAYTIVHRGSALACSDAMRSAYSDEHHRAERLEEALREYANPENWAVLEGRRRVWTEPGSSTPDAYNGYEMANGVLSALSTNAATQTGETNEAAE